MNGNNNTVNNSGNNTGILAVVEEQGREVANRASTYTAEQASGSTPYQASQEAFGSSAELARLSQPASASANGALGTISVGNLLTTGFRERSLEAGDHLAALDSRPGDSERVPESPRQSRLAGPRAEPEGCTADMVFSCEEVFTPEELAATRAEEGGLRLAGGIGWDGDGDPNIGEGYGWKFRVESNGSDPLANFKLSSNFVSKVEDDPLGVGLFEALGI